MSGPDDLARRGSRAALALAGRSIALRLLTFGGTIVLARLLDPTDFGTYGMIAFVIAIWTAVGDFGLGAALVQQAAPPTRIQLGTVWTAQQGIALAAVAAVWLLAPALGLLGPNMPAEGVWMLRVLAVGLLFSSLRALPAVMMERELRFGPLAAAEVLQQATFYGVAIGLACGHAGAWSFVVGGLAQLAVGALVVNLAWPHLPRVGLDRAALAELFGFGVAYQASTVILTIRDAPLPFLVGVSTGTVSAGLMQFALRIAMTIATIDEMVARIAFPAFSRLQSDPARRTRALETAVLMSALVLAPAQMWLAALAPAAVPFVFGVQWQEAILPLQLLCVATLFRFPARYLRQLEFAQGATRRGLAMSIGTTALTLVCSIAGLSILGLSGAALGFLVGSVAGLGISIRLAEGAPGLAWKGYWSIIGTGAAAGLAGVAALDGIVGALFSGSSSATNAESAIVAGALATSVFSLVCLVGLFVTSRPALRLAWQLARASGSGSERPSEAPNRG